MARQFRTSIDLNQHELQNFRVGGLAAAPNNPVEGQEYFNTTDKKKYVYNGTTWQAATGLTGDNITIAEEEGLLGVKAGSIGMPQFTADVQDKLRDDYYQTFGDGTATSFTITHNLESTIVMVQIIDATTGADIVCDVTRNAANTIQITADPAIAADGAIVMVKKMGYTPV